MLCVGNSGDWTGQLFDKIRAPCHRPVYVIGPYMSEFSDAAVGSTNVIAIASDELDIILLILLNLSMQYHSSIYLPLHRNRHYPNSLAYAFFRWEKEG